ncbi:cation diffusion facilitator family transporter [Asticcacaulis sp. AND118]|uniref:cation diffusion facilitator family transporter n=1 Tax=Asticcacaulis sp. AND118 TaxID=2840468 RepID=UPI001CFF570F|nr:cation diffusion facilitator family transporter [Asticcacaulis sp. AND118]UDF04069.1 cation diffusion facilitator family transporter [Asticcacaulis sp. AND118]
MSNSHDHHGGHGHSGHDHSSHKHSGHDHSGHNHAGHGDHGHGDHDHSHVPAVSKDNEHKILISFFIIFGFMIVEVIGGYISGSLALLADAGHMMTDALALGLAYLAFRLGRRAADGKRTFGYMRFEVIAGLINALTLFAIVGWIIYEAIERFQSPQPVLAGPMFGVAVVGMLVNVLVLWYLTRGDTDHVNVKGAILHVMGDLLGSIGAIIAAIVIWLTDWTPIDPILSVLVSLLVLRSAWSLLKRTLHILLEGAPKNATAAAVTEHLEKTVPSLQRVSHIHVWQITSARTLATLHVQPKAGADLRALVEQVEHELTSKFSIEHPTVAIDWKGNASCSLEKPAAQPASGCVHAH